MNPKQSKKEPPDPSPFLYVSLFGGLSPSSPAMALLSTESSSHCALYPCLNLCHYRVRPFFSGPLFCQFQICASMAGQASDPLHFVVVVPGLAFCSSQFHRNAKLEPLSFWVGLGNSKRSARGCLSVRRMMQVADGFTRTSSASSLIPRSAIVDCSCPSLANPFGNGTSVCPLLFRQSQTVWDEVKGKYPLVDEDMLSEKSPFVLLKFATDTHRLVWYIGAGDRPSHSLHKRRLATTFEEYSRGFGPQGSMVAQCTLMIISSSLRMYWPNMNVVARAQCILEDPVNVLYGCIIPSIISCTLYFLKDLEQHLSVLRPCLVALDVHPRMLGLPKKNFFSYQL